MKKTASCYAKSATVENPQDSLCLNKPTLIMKSPNKPKPKRPRGHPIVRAIKIDATPEQVGQAMFKAGRKSNKSKS